MLKFVVSQDVTYVEQLVLTRDKVVELLNQHDPEADFSRTTNGDLLAVLLATLNDYTDSELHEYCVDNAIGQDILNVTDWYGSIVSF